MATDFVAPKIGIANAHLRFPQQEDSKHARAPLILRRAHGVQKCFASKRVESVANLSVFVRPVAFILNTAR